MENLVDLIFSIYRSCPVRFLVHAQPADLEIQVIE